MTTHVQDRVTVIVPSRNSGPFVAATVQSALAQHPDAVDVLVIDDGSSDDGPLGLPAFGDPRVRVLCQPRRGPARTLNLALALARTPWVTIVPARDALAPGWLDAVRAALVAPSASSGEAGAGASRPAAVFVRPTLVDRLGEPLLDPPSGDPFASASDLAADGLRLALLERCPVCLTGALLDRGRVLRAGGFDPSLRLTYDHDLWLRLLREASAVVLAERFSRVTWPGSLGEASGRDEARVERGYVLAKAVGGGVCAAEWLAAARRPAPGATGAEIDAADAAARIEVARRVLRSGAHGVLGLAAELVADARAAGATAPAGEEFAPLHATFPALFAPDGEHDVHDEADLERGVALDQVSPLTARDVASPADRDDAHPHGRERRPLRVALQVVSLDRGGLETVVVRLSRALRDSGHVPLVICTDGGGAGAEALRADGIEVVVLRGADRARDLARLLDARAIELVNTHFAHFSSLGTPVAAALGIPVVVTLHNTYAWFGSGVLDEMRALDPLVAGYVAVSESVAASCALRFAIARERMIVLRNPVAPGGASAPAIARDAARRALGVPIDARLLVQVGRVDPVKCQLALVAAMERLAAARPELHAWIVGGDGDPSYAHRVRERIRAAGLEQRVVLAGERGDVPTILAAADVFVMPSVLEGLSLAAIEAMAAGVPAVLTRTGDAAWLLGEDGGGVLPGALIEGPALAPHAHSEVLNRVAASDDPPHAAALADAIASLLDDLPRRADRARARAAELAAILAPGDWLDRHVDLFTAVAADGAVRRATSLARAARRLDADAAVERASRAALEGSVDELARVLAGNLASQRVAGELGTTRGEVAIARAALTETEDTLGRTLDKLRITHRMRSALGTLIRRPPGRT